MKLEVWKLLFESLRPTVSPPLSSFPVLTFWGHFFFFFFPFSLAPVISDSVLAVVVSSLDEVSTHLTLLRLFPSYSHLARE